MDKVYVITDGIYVKIGYTSQDLHKRLKQLSTSSPKKLYILGWIYGDKKKERELHCIHHSSRVNREWFKPDDIIIWLNENNQMDVYVDYLDGRLMTFKKIKK